VFLCWKSLIRQQKTEFDSWTHAIVESIARQKRIPSMIKQYYELKSLKEEAEEMLENLRISSEKLAGELKEPQEQLDAAAVQLKALRERKEELARELQRLDSKIGESKRRVQNLKSECSDTQSRTRKILDELAVSYGDKKNEVLGLREENESLRKKIQDLEN